MSLPVMSVLLHEQKGHDMGRWVGKPKGCKQHGRVWAQLYLVGPPFQCSRPISAMQVAISTET